MEQDTSSSACPSDISKNYSIRYPNEARDISLEKGTRCGLAPIKLSFRLLLWANPVLIRVSLMRDFQPSTISRSWFFPSCNHCAMGGNCGKEQGPYQPFGASGGKAAKLGKFHHDLNQRPKPIDDGECKVNCSLLWP